MVTFLYSLHVYFVCNILLYTIMHTYSRKQINIISVQARKHIRKHGCTRARTHTLTRTHKLFLTHTHARVHTHPRARTRTRTQARSNTYRRVNGILTRTMLTPKRVTVYSLASVSSRSRRQFPCGATYRSCTRGSRRQWSRTRARDRGEFPERSIVPWLDA